ncbi:MAG: hypothetical protein AAF081_18850, partial [Actinomycetota bacterium]
MTVDHRSRLHVDEVALDAAAAIDGYLPDRIRTHGELAGRGLAVKGLPTLGFVVGGRSTTLA